MSVCFRLHPADYSVCDCFGSTVYEQLGKVGEVANQVLCRQRVDEMEPNIRYCNYKMGKTDVAGSGIRELAEEADSPGFGILQSKLEV